MGKIKQKDIVLVSLDPIFGHEQSGTRPAVVVSADSFHVSRMCLICPVTQKIKNFFGDIILVPKSKNGLDGKSEILTGQIRSIDQRRVVKKIGEVSDEDLRSIFISFDALCNR